MAQGGDVMIEPSVQMTRALVSDVAAESREKLPVFHGNGKDEIRAKDLIRRIEA